MEKHLGDIITKEEARQIVLHAIGREATDQELEESEVEFIDEYKGSVLDEERFLSQTLTIPLYEFADRDYPTMKIVININGMVQYKNWSGSVFPMQNPLEIYKIIVSKAEDIEKLWKSI